MNLKQHVTGRRSVGMLFTHITRLVWCGCFTPIQGPGSCIVIRICGHHRHPCA